MFHTTSQTNAQLSTLVTRPSSVTTAVHPIAPDDAITIDYLTITFETFLEQVFPAQGFVLLHEEGHLLHSSPKARRLCKALQESVRQALEGEANQQAIGLPPIVKKLAADLIESRLLFPDLLFQLQDEVWLEDLTQVRLQVEWFDIADPHSPYIMITLEDCTEVAHQRAQSDAYRYHLTPRETEVWELHLRGSSYRQIGKMLFIEINTVKKHMKSIHSKRKGVLP